MTAPLAGVRIIDCSWLVAGPLASRLLADFGAEVIKIESGKQMDIGRGNRELLFGKLPGDANSNAEKGGYFWDANAGKRSCTLNLRTQGGRDTLARLAAVSDGIVCNLSGDQLERWGLDYARLRALNPRIIVVNMPAMESHGPRVAWRAFGEAFAGAGGMVLSSGHPGEPPLSFGHQYPDFSCNPFHAAIGFMAALHERERTGQGQFIEVSQYESTAAMLGPAVLDYTANGCDVSPQGNRDPLASPHNVYRCKGTEAWCAIAVFTAEQWQRLRALSGLPALRRRAFDSLEGRKAHEDEIDRILEEWTREWEPQELAEYLQTAGIPAGPFQSVQDHVERDPVLGERYFHPMDHPAGLRYLVHGSPIQSRTNPPQPGPGPTLGQHTLYVLEEVLGLSLDEIAELASSGALD